MTDRKIQSEAFQRAALNSERIRILGLLGVLAATLLILIARIALMDSPEQAELLPRAVALLGGMALYEVFMLWRVRGAIRNERSLPAKTWEVNVFVETLLPTTAMLILTTSTYFGPYRALTAPTVLLYFFFIVLSTLRLSPLLSALTGLFSAAGYLAVMAYTYLLYPADAATFSAAIYLTYAVLILFGGVIAAGVAAQIRTHVQAALREAETRRQMERLEHDLEIASSIQKGLLPQEAPQIEGFQLAGWNQPADETGGDYYDWQQLPDGRLAISLADVTGHGIGPALVTAVCRAYGRASFPAGGGLAIALDRINNLLVEDLPTGKLVTFVVALLDARQSKVSLMSAGHGPLLHYTAADDTVREFKAHGVPFGVMEGMDYGPSDEIIFATGDMLILITDGFFEWANADDEEFGVERLNAAIREAKDLPPDEIIALLHQKVTAFAGGTPQNDDLTAVILKKV